MPWNGLGTYSPPPASFPEVNGTIVDAARFDATVTDIAAGISLAFNRNGENSPTADLPMGGHKLTGLGAGSATGQSIRYEQVLGATNDGGANIYYLPSGASAVARTLKAKAREIVSLMDFGAIGDGVADDTGALVLALAAAATGNQNLFVPAGTYKIISTVTLPPKVSIIGCGRDASIFSFTGTGYLFSKIIANHITTASWIDAEYRHFAISGSALGTGGFYMEYTNFLKWEDLYIHGFTGVTGRAVNLKENYFYWFVNCKFIDCAAAQVVLEAGATTGCNAGYIGPNNEFNGNNQTNCIALSVVGQGIAIVGNDFEGAGNGNKAIDLNGCDGIDIFQNYIELWNGAAIAANSGSACSRVSVRNNVINAASATVCPFNNGGAANSRITFENNRFADLTGAQTCVAFGTSTKIQTSNNDPGVAIFSDLYGTEGKYLSCLTGFSTYDPPSIAAGATTATTLAITGAAVGDLVIASHSAVGTNNVVFEGNVQAAGVVRVIITNREAGPIDLVSGTLKVAVLRISA